MSQKYTKATKTVFQHLPPKKGRCRDIQHNDIQHSDTQQKGLLVTLSIKAIQYTQHKKHCFE